MRLGKEDILYEDDEIIVCRKKAGIATQTSRPGEADMASALRNYLKTAYIGVVHRLDQPVEGILVFARTKKSAARLSEQNREKTMCKHYCAAAVSLSGKVEKGEYVLADYLLKDGKENISKVVEKGTPGAKRAELAYKIIKIKQTGEQQVVLLEIVLKTGRHHQIRVQLSHAGLPLLGDAKYGGRTAQVPDGEHPVKNVALCADRLEFLHPVTGKRMSFEIEPSDAVFHIFSS